MHVAHVKGEVTDLLSAVEALAMKGESDMLVILSIGCTCRLSAASAFQ